MAAKRDLKLVFLDDFKNFTDLSLLWGGPVLRRLGFAQLKGREEEAGGRRDRIRHRCWEGTGVC